MRKGTFSFKAEVTLIPEAKRNRIIRAGQYMPHIVMGDPGQREAIVVPEIGIVEEYIGVRFVGGPETLEIGIPAEVALELMYLPVEEFSKISPGDTFTLREGGSVVGFGHVIDGPSQSSNLDPTAAFRAHPRA